MSDVATLPTCQHDLAAILQSYNDVTERLMRSHSLLGREVCRLRDELTEKNQELQRRERLAALGEMAAGMAHEIRNPLGAISLYATLLERELGDGDQDIDRLSQRARTGAAQAPEASRGLRPAAQVRSGIARGDLESRSHLVGRIRAGIHILERVVDDILAFACAGEPAARGARPRRQVVRLGSILDGVVIHAAPQVASFESVIDVERGIASAELYCDAAQVERALLNLVLNALDAAGKGGRVSIRMGPDTDEDLLPIAVEDNGAGIPPADLQRIFDPFFTTKDTGTGLGLAIVHRIAEMHGGRVRADNRAEGGAVFVLSVPKAIKEGKRQEGKRQQATGNRQ